jgi:hypothetical protein
MHAMLSGCFYFILAIVLAAAEVEIEGKYGWAANLPTWHRTKGPAAKIYGLLMNKKPLTGYHAFMFFLPLLIFHLPFFNFSPAHWSIKAELSTLAIYFMFVTVWDFLWFVLNPFFGAENFKRENVWWHSQSPWLLKLPLDYWMGLAISLALSFLAGNLPYQVCLWFCLIGGTVAAIIFSPQYHNWYWRMRQKNN